MRQTCGKAAARRVAAAGVQAAAGVRSTVEMKFEQALAMEMYILLCKLKLNLA